MLALKKSLALHKIKVVGSNDKPDFKLKILKLKITENTSTDTVKHKESPDNGKVFELTSGLFKLNGIITRTLTGKNYSWTGDKSKREKKTSFQSAKQMIMGENKSLTKYREKEFDQYIFRNMSGTCGSNSGVSITKGVKRLLK